MKPNKAASLTRRSKILKKNEPRPSKKPDSRKIHDTKGKDKHSRNF